MRFHLDEITNIFLNLIPKKKRDLAYKNPKIMYDSGTAKMHCIMGMPRMTETNFQTPVWTAT